MDRALDPELLRSLRFRRWTIAGASAAVLALLFLLLPAWLRPSVRRDTLRTARVERGPVEAVVQASGNAVPALERALSSPVDARIERIVKHPGEAVSAGDEIVVLDTSASRLDLARLEDRLAQKANEQAQARLALETETASLESRVESQKLEASIASYRFEQEKKLRVEGLVSEESLRAAEVVAQKAAIELEQSKRAIVAARQSTDSKLAGLELDLGILRKERDEARRQLDLANARAERDGVVTWVVPQEGVTLHRGETVARVADLGSFRIEATVSDVHSSRLAAGQPARVLLGGEAILDGRVATVNPTIENGVLRFTVELDSPHDARLRNNLRVEVAVVTGHADGALRVRRGGFVEDGGESLFVIAGNRAVRRPARLGLVGYADVEIVSGLAEGEEVILTDMKDYAGLDELRLR